jgi:uncharacterized membrane protein
MDVKTTTIISTFTALFTAATLLIKIPVPATQGYINLGVAAVIMAECTLMLRQA